MSFKELASVPLYCRSLAIFWIYNHSHFARRSFWLFCPRVQQSPYSAYHTVVLSILPKCSSTAWRQYVSWYMDEVLGFFFQLRYSIIAERTAAGPCPDAPAHIVQHLPHAAMMLTENIKPINKNMPYTYFFSRTYLTILYKGKDNFHAIVVDHTGKNE